MGTIKQNIDLGINELLKLSDELKKDLETLWRKCQDKDKMKIDSQQIKELFDKADEIAFQVVNLNGYNTALYANRGKSSSEKKQASSRENGKKGGRPPKEISEKKKRIAELQTKFFEDNLSDDEEKEFAKLKEDIEVWKKGK